MRVERRRQAVVQVLAGTALCAAKVDRLSHAAGGQHADELVEVGVALADRPVQ